VHLDVLMVRTEGGTWADTAVRSDANGQPVQAPPFSDLAAPRGRGAYLLWAPPDALARGTKPHDDPEGPVRFAALPERWLVLRIAPSVNGQERRSVRGWVLKADEPGSKPVPLAEYVDPIAPADGKTQGEPVTVVGPGQLDWIGYFDNVEGRFGFHDPLDDVSAGPIAYLVCGWYRDDDLDPLSDPDIRTQADFERRVEQFGWQVPDGQFAIAKSRAIKHSQALDLLGMEVAPAVKAQRRASVIGAEAGREGFEQPLQVKDALSAAVHVAPAQWWPRHCLFHGAVVGIGWPNFAVQPTGAPLVNEEVGGPPNAKGVTVGFGTTLTEALAALVAQRDGHPEHARILQAFKLGAINELEEPDGRAKVDALLHASTFSSLPGGTVTERVYQPPLGEPPRETTLKPPGHGVFERYYHRDVKGSPDVRDALLGQSAKASAKAPFAAATRKSSSAGAFEAVRFAGKQLEAEMAVQAGGASAAAKHLELGTQRPPYRPGRWVDRERPLPRLYRPLDPVLVIEGVHRAYQYGGDGRFSRDGLLGCRLTGAPVKDYRVAFLDRTLHAEDILDAGIGNGSVPPECDDLLSELLLLDPGSAPVLVKAATRGERLSAQVERDHAETMIAQQTAWWAMRDRRADTSALVNLAPFTGTLPSPVAINLPSRPWNPLHLEWQVEYVESPGAASDWSLGELDYDEQPADIPALDAQTRRTITGRCPLAAGAGRTIASAIRRTLADARAQRSEAGGLVDVDAVHEFADDLAHSVSLAMAKMVVTTSAPPGGEQLDAAERASLGDIADALEQADVLSAPLDGLHTMLRGGLAGDGTTRRDDGSVPDGFVALRAGFLRVVRLRVVDAFGQVLDLAGSSAQQPADATRILRSEPLEVTDHPELLALPPRLTSPARLWLRFTDGSGGPEEARSATDVDAAISPVCGYLMPNHVDDALLFYGADGHDQGVVRRDEDGRVVWEDAPGAPSTVGASPALAVDNSFCAGIAQGLLDWGMVDAGLIPGQQADDNALRALMRVIDTTRWTTDPFGRQGEEHLALLVGHPVVVVRAVVRLEVQEPVDPDAVNAQTLTLRLGALTHWQDGLLGYFVNDDYRTLHCSDAAVAELARAFGPQQGFLDSIESVPDHEAALGDAESAAPVTHAYVDRSGELVLRPNQDVRLTLLVEPHTLVHATCGVLPRKEVGLRREWTQDALAKLSPTFRFGPVLVDPNKVRMPVAVDLHGSWSWDHRKSVTEWENQPVTHATQEALLPQDPPIGSEGWLRLRPIDDEKPEASS
jgi:hypothetical protein